MNLRKYLFLVFSPFSFNDNCTYVKHVDKNIHNYRIQFFIIFIFFLVLYISYMLFYSMFKFNFVNMWYFWIVLKQMCKKVFYESIHKSEVVLYDLVW